MAQETWDRVHDAGVNAAKESRFVDAVLDPGNPDTIETLRGYSIELHLTRREAEARVIDNKLNWRKQLPKPLPPIKIIAA